MNILFPVLVSFFSAPVSFQKSNLPLVAFSSLDPIFDPSIPSWCFSHHCLGNPGLGWRDRCCWPCTVVFPSRSSVLPFPHPWHSAFSPQAPLHPSLKCSCSLLLLAVLAASLCPLGVFPRVRDSHPNFAVGWDQHLRSYREFSTLERKRTLGTAAAVGEQRWEHCQLTHDLWPRAAARVKTASASQFCKRSQGSWALVLGTQTLLSLKVLSLHDVFPWVSILGPSLKKPYRCYRYSFQRVDVQQRTNLFEPGEGSTENKRVKQRNNLRWAGEKAFLSTVWRLGPLPRQAL